MSQRGAGLSTAALLMAHALGPSVRGMDGVCLIITIIVMVVGVVVQERVYAGRALRRPDQQSKAIAGSDVQGHAQARRHSLPFRDERQARSGQRRSMKR